MYDVCVVGGGAAGLSCAIAAARNGYKVCILDQNKKIGKKLYATGNGKCNVTNAYMDIKRCYHSSSKDYVEFLERGIGSKATDDVLDFLREIGVTCVEKNGYYYPMSQQASTVVWSMLDACKKLGVSVMEQCLVHEITPDYTVIYDKDGSKHTLNAKNVVLACGGKSYSKLGGSMFGYDLIEKMSISMTKLRPCLCGIKVEDNFEAIKGVRVQAKATFEKSGVNYEESGELQITDYGLSGIMIFNLSSLIGQVLEKDKSTEISLDFMQDVVFEDFARQAKIMNQRTLLGMLNTFLPDKLAYYLLEQIKINPKQLVLEMNEDDQKKIYNICKNYKVKVTGLTDYDMAQVTAGGVRLEEVSADTFESKKHKGLYIVGEMLDIDGICGGYNITFAILSGKRAGEQVTC